MDPIILKFKMLFLEEAMELLNSYESDLLQLEKEPKNSELIDSAFRSMHTLKGMSGMYGFKYICELTHHLESIFQSIKEKRQEFNKELFDLTFSSIDHMRKLLSDEGLEDKKLNKEYRLIIKKLSVPINTVSISQSFGELEQNNNKKELALWHIMLNTTESQYFRGISFMNIFRDLANLGCFSITKIESISGSESDKWSITLQTSSTQQDILDVFMFVEDDCKITPISDNIEHLNNHLVENCEISILDAIGINKNQKPDTKSPENQVKLNNLSLLKRISVDSEKLDHLMFLVSELIILNSELSLSVKNHSYDSISNNMEKLSSLSKQFRENALDLHLVPLNNVVLRFQRLIRDLSKELGKKIDFQTSGTEIEIDKSIIDKLSDPLMHIIRNCIDHGIETPEQRIKQGKPDTGIIKLSAYSSGAKTHIKIEDDGNGINTEKIRQKAIDLGFIKATDNLKTDDLMEFIFKPGFSTAQGLSSISGRGVGMDIVKNKIHELRGDIFVETTMGKGASFMLVLQQSISIIVTLLFKVENTFFTVPIADIVKCLDFSASELGARNSTCTIAYEDQLIPYIDIRKAFKIEGDYMKKIKIIIVKNNERMMALLTDTIIGEHQAVLKPINRNIHANKLLCSVSQLGDGKMAFMIDTHELLENFKLYSSKSIGILF